MCGIAGFLENAADRSDEGLSRLAMAMANALLHRGPDSGDAWAEASTGIALSHRRLAIVDLSSAGAQPMVSACGRYVLAYNGEVYNHNDIRPELEENGIKFRGHSDTEVILEGCARWGIKATVRKLIGMFAFALWDRHERRLTLVRDRLGIKPLYWAQTSKSFLFGSELKALRSHPDCPGEINRNSVAGFLRHNYIGGANSIYQGVNKLEPGWMLSVRAGEEPVLERYWSLDDVVAEAQAKPFTGSDTEAVDALHDLLMDATGRRMMADVPLGAFLSGGIDSSTVVALMQAQSERAVKTFSIGFNEEGYNEARHAAEVARHLKTDHTELYVSPSEARDVIPQLPFYFDEPFSDSSQIPTYLVSKMTRGHVTVALSGDGGDELFGGYTRYFTAEKYGRSLFGQPQALRNLEAYAIRSLSPSTWDSLSNIIPASRRPSLFGDKLYKLANLLNGERDDFYRGLISHWHNPDDLVIGGVEPRGLVWDEAVKQRVPDFIDRMQYLDTMTYLPDDILTKVDRASMAVSLEARVPLLDHRVVDFAWRLPRHMKIRNGQGKWLLRQVLYKYVPKEMVERPKMGFGVPIDAWLRGPLREWAEELLSPAALQSTGLLESAPVQKKWQEHLSGRRNWQYLLWDVLMLQAWHHEHCKPVAMQKYA
ncbi:asparagine synthase (glutamine-hydrolyzing) [Kiloniella laminariae]|uniref:asparagine synthase (glutamine-hydrolyzing) n=1 Tax=Kiloniella laminariae TaxID=454162 RepID=A0ABT4LPW9_9PROT|nr:asparagine synthase (glutamine-hydrolyzing) [Kiloniella laminariae]MCZ4282361.1 asparagine synthase (glutamine-hydrolyzing) [Kiloniella laminariae]